MKFRIKSDKNRRVQFPVDKINIYTSRWLPDTWFDVEIKRKVKKRSDPLRKYYFAAVLAPFAKELGYERDEHLLLHRQLKITYWQVKPDERGIYRNKDVPSVFSDKSDIDVPVKKEFVDWVIRKAAHYGVIVEDPN
jgi:hypothetical protein